MTCSIAMARKSIEHLIALHETHSDGSMQSICNQAKHGAVVLAWLEKRQELMKAELGIEPDTLLQETESAA